MSDARDEHGIEYRQALFLYTAAIKALDAVTVMVVWRLCWLLRFDTKWFPVTRGLPSLEVYEATALPLALVFCAALHLVGAYRSDRLHFGFRTLKKLVQGSVVGTLIFVSLSYFQGQILYSRLYLALFSGAVIAGLVLERGLVHVAWAWLRRHLVRRVRVLVVGAGDLLQLYVAQIRSRDPYPVAWVGRLGEPGQGGELGKLPYLGREDRLTRELELMQVDQVVLSYPAEASPRYQELLERLSNELVAVKVIPDYGKYNTFTYLAGQEFGVPLLAFNHTPVGATDRFVKRVVDLLGAAFLLIVLSPVLVAIALAVRLTSRGPAIYRQRRVGADGREFTCYKFRSMTTDAENATGPVWARKGDPRVTPVGRWLRASSLDELPQLFNVLRGDMSFVGPRPERPHFVEKFRHEIPKYMLRHKMKSGMTGWAQVNGLRGNTSLKERIQYDLYYIGHWSHVFDLKILLMTPWIVLKGLVKGHAY